MTLIKWRGNLQLDFTNLQPGGSLLGAFNSELAGTIQDQATSNKLNCGCDSHRIRIRLEQSEDRTIPLDAIDLSALPAAITLPTKIPQPVH
jgi:hypothetical protein